MSKLYIYGQLDLEIRELFESAYKELERQAMVKELRLKIINGAPPIIKIRSDKQKAQWKSEVPRHLRNR